MVVRDREGRSPRTNKKSERKMYTANLFSPGFFYDKHRDFGSSKSIILNQNTSSLFR